MKQQTHVHSRQIAMTHDRTVTWDCHEIAANIQLFTFPGCVPIVAETVAETLQHPQDLQSDRYQKSAKAALAASTAEAAAALQVGLLSWQKAHMKSGFLAPI